MASHGLLFSEYLIFLFVPNIYIYIYIMYFRAFWCLLVSSCVFWCLLVSSSVVSVVLLSLSVVSVTFSVVVVSYSVRECPSVSF